MPPFAKRSHLRALFGLCYTKPVFLGACDDRLPASPANKQLAALLQWLAHPVLAREHLEDIDRVGDLSQLDDAEQDSSVPTILVD